MARTIFRSIQNAKRRNVFDIWCAPSRISARAWSAAVLCRFGMEDECFSASFDHLSHLFTGVEKRQRTGALQAASRLNPLPSQAKNFPWVQFWI
jgi:hypothetical protein